MNFNKFKANFNFITNIIILLILIIGSLTWADTNGIWTDAKDVRGGIFGSDEQPVTSNYTFINPVYFNNFLKSSNSSYFMNISGRTQLNDLVSSKFDSINISMNGIGLNNVYVNENQNDSINSLMIIDNSINSSDINSNQIQKRITGICPSSKYMYGVNLDGTVLCRTDTTGGGGGTSCIEYSTIGGGQCGYTCRKNKWVANRRC